MRKRLLAILLFGCVGCLTAPPTPHTPLSAPSQDAPFPKREEAYQELRPDRAQALVVTDGANQELERGIFYMTLGSGMPVYYPEDLLPVVSPQSKTAQAIQLMQQETQRANKLTTVSRIITGSTIVLSGLLVAGLSQSSPAARNDSIVFATFTSGALVWWISSRPANAAVRRAGKARDDAFHHYGADLREHLSICKEGGTLYDCNNPPKSSPEEKEAPSSQPTSTPENL